MVPRRLKTEDPVDARPTPRLARCANVEEVLVGLLEIAAEQGIDPAGIRLLRAGKEYEFKSSKTEVDLSNVQEVKIDVEATRLVLLIRKPVNKKAVGQIEDAAYVAAQRIELLSLIGKDPKGERQGSGASPSGEVLTGNSGPAPDGNIDGVLKGLTACAAKNGLDLPGVRFARGGVEQEFTLAGEGLQFERAGKGETTLLLIPGFIGKTEAVHELERAVRNAANSELSVLIVGEPGTGKELVARGIHQRSDRSRGPFVVVNCAALPADLIESELFGHEKGAFTGALARRKGKFELAHGGTIFLDEIGDLPLQSQVKLLRVLQERVLERVGGNQPFAVDVRVVAATNRNLEAMIKEGGFREDLYYRLKERRLRLPTLRERSADIPLLVEHFLSATAQRRNHRFRARINNDVMDFFRDYRWPGNVRQLKSTVEVLAENAGDGGVITLEEARREISLEQTEMNSPGEIIHTVVLREGESLVKLTNRMILETYEKVKKHCGGSHAAAARWLKINRTTLYRLVNRARLIVTGQ